MRQQAQPARRVAAIEEVERFWGGVSIAAVRRSIGRGREGGRLDGRTFQECAGAVMGFQQRLDPRAQVAVGARFFQESQPVGRILLDGSKKNLLHVRLLRSQSCLLKHSLCSSATF
jgi:hypothetical protein